MKKGLSPLISAVLLIAFVVTLFLVITNWIQSGVVEEVTSRTDDKLGSQLDCLSTEIVISGACAEDAADDGNFEKVEVNVDNTGDTIITGVIVRLSNAVGTLGSFEMSGETAAPLARVVTKTETGAKTLNTAVPNPSRIEVYPVIASGTCQDQVKLVTSVTDCNPPTP